MQLYLKHMLCVFVFSSILSTGFGIKCFTCSSKTDPKCMDPFDNSTVVITDCAVALGLPRVENTLCRKIRQKVNGEWNFIRECALPEDHDEVAASFRSGKETCVTKNRSNNILTEYCICNNKDGCNSSFNFKPSYFLLVLMILPTFVVKILS